VIAKVGVAALALLLAACQDIPGGPLPDPQVVGAPTELVLAVGDEALVDGLLLIGFTDVKADSRCPASVLCAWAGDGEVEIAAGIGRGASRPYRLHTLLDPTQVDLGSYRIRLVELMPYPQVPGTIPLDAYVIRLEVSHLSQ